MDWNWTVAWRAALDKEKNVWPKPIQPHWSKIYKLKIYYTSNLRLSWDSELLLSKEMDNENNNFAKFMRTTTLPNLSITSDKHKLFGGVCLTIQVKQMQNVPCNTNIQRYSSLRSIFPWDCRIQKRNSRKNIQTFTSNLWWPRVPFIILQQTIRNQIS